MRSEVHGLKFLSRFQNLLRNVHPKALTPPELEEPIRAELFSSERLEQHAESPGRGTPVTVRREWVVRCCRVCWITGGCCSMRIEELPRRFARGARSYPRRNGWSTISTSWTNSCTRSMMTSRLAITESCRSSPRVLRKAIQASSGWRGPCRPYGQPI